METQTIQITKLNEETIVSSMKKDGWELQTKTPENSDGIMQATFVKADKRTLLNG